MTNTSRFKVFGRTTESFSNSQQDITSVGDIERNGQLVRLQMSCSFPNGLAAQFLTGQTTADVANVVDTSFHIKAAATDISDAQVSADNSRMRFVG